MIDDVDKEGDNKNFDLSKLIALAVKIKCIRRFDLKEDYSQVIEKSESKPIADNKTEDGKKQNTRVEFKIIK